MKSFVELPSSELKEALTGLRKVVGRSTLPVLQSIRLTRNHAGVVRLEGTDLDSTVEYRLADPQEGAGIDVLVPLDRLMKLTKGSKDRVCIFPEDKQVVIQTFVGSTPLEHKVEAIDIKEWPQLPQVTKKGMTLDDEFRNAFWEAMECASQDDTRYILQSVYLDTSSKKAHYLVSTNGRALFSANSFTFDLKGPLIIPTRKFLGWSGWWMEGDAQLAFERVGKNDQTGWLKFSRGPWTFTTKGVAGVYPNWLNVIPHDEPQTTVQFHNEAVKSILEVIARLPGDELKDRDITLNISESTVVFQGRAKFQDHAASVPIPQSTVKGKPVVIALNRTYLQQALQFGLTELNIIDPLAPMMFKAGGKRLIVMPLRPDVSESKAPSKNPPPPPTPPAIPTEPTQPEERKAMPKTTTTPDTQTETTDSPFKKAAQQIDSIKDALKKVVQDLAEVLTVLKTAEKEKKTSDKEIEAVREKLREIQSVTI